MTARTDICLQINVFTVKLPPAPMTDEDMDAPEAELQRMQHINRRAEAGKLFIHQADCIEHHKGGEPTRGLMQSSMFDIDESDGQHELRELLDFIKETTIKHLYP